jgi:hypothetical protein
MDNLRRFAAGALVAALLFMAAPALAQSGGNFGQKPTFTQTTLSAALTSNALTMTVASATGFTVNTTEALIGDELVGISSISGTTIGIRRGQGGTKATTHGNGMPVWVAANANFSACGGNQGGSPCGYFYNGGDVTRYSPFLFFPTTIVTNLTTAGNLTWTVGQVLGGIITRDTNGGARTDTLPTAALLVAGIPGVTVGSTFDFTVYNTAGGANTLTVAVGTGGTGQAANTLTVAQSNMKIFRIRFTAVDSGNEAYTLFSLGTTVF